MGRGETSRGGVTSHNVTRRSVTDLSVTAAGSWRYVGDRAHRGGPSVLSDSGETVYDGSRRDRAVKPPSAPFSATVPGDTAGDLKLTAAIKLRIENKETVNSFYVSVLLKFLRVYFGKNIKLLHSAFKAVEGRRRNHTGLEKPGHWDRSPGPRKCLLLGGPNVSKR